MKNDLSYPRTMFVTNSLRGGGAERATNILVNALTDLGVEVSLVAVNSSEPDLILPKCEVFELMRPWQGGIGSLLTAYLRFNKVVKQWSPDIIVLNCDAPELLGALLFRGQLNVVVEHSSKPWGTRKLLGRFVRFIFKARDAKWVAVSSHLRIWPNNQQPDTWISNAVAHKQNEVNPANKRKQLHTGRKISRLLYIGRLSEEKQPGWVLEIAKQSGLPTILYGEGRLSDLLIETSLETSIVAQFPGFISDPWELVAVGDLLIIPSAFEGDGLVLIESLANQVPLLVNSIPDLLRFDLPERNYCSSPKQFVDRINKFSQNIDELQVPEETISKILENRSPNRIAGKWKDFLADLG